MIKVNRAPGFVRLRENRAAISSGRGATDDERGAAAGLADLGVPIAPRNCNKRPPQEQGNVRQGAN